jgi:hypothetical protein
VGAAKKKEPKWTVSAFDGRWQSRDRFNDGHNDRRNFVDESSALEFAAQKLRYFPVGNDAYIRVEQRVNHYPYTPVVEAWDGDTTRGWTQVLSRKKKLKRGELAMPTTPKTVRVAGDGKHDGLSFGVVHEGKFQQARKYLDARISSGAGAPWTVPDSMFDEYSSYGDACTRAVARALEDGDAMVIVFVTDLAAAHAWNGREGVERFKRQRDARDVLYTPVHESIEVNAYSRGCR